MKILKLLTSASPIAMLVGCAGNETGEKDIPVPVPEKETVLPGEPSVPSKKNTEATPKENVGGKTVKEGTSVKVSEAGNGTEETAAVNKAAREDTATTGSAGAATEEGEPTESVPAVNEAFEEVKKSVETKETAPDKEEEVTPEVTEVASIDKDPAQEKAEATCPGTGKCSGRSGWYAGIEGGLDFAESGMSSFGTGGTRAGGGAGLAVGYRFNSWLSMELGASFGKARMTAYGCCSDANLWLSDEGEIFNAAVLGMNGGYYSELESAVFFQKYGLRVNFDILGLIPETRDGKWSLELSPEILAMGPSAKISKSGATIYSATNWQAGLGGRLQAGYAFLPWMRAGVFTSLDFGLGSHIDALPQNGHRRNYIWESGVRMVFSIPDKKSRR